MKWNWRGGIEVRPNKKENGATGSRVVKKKECRRKMRKLKGHVLAVGCSLKGKAIGKTRCLSFSRHDSQYSWLYPRSTNTHKAEIMRWDPTQNEGIRNRKRKKKEGRITKKMGCPADRRNFSLFLIWKGNIFQKRKETRADLIDESKKKKRKNFLLVRPVWSQTSWHISWTLCGRIMLWVYAIRIPDSSLFTALQLEWWLTMTKECSNASMSR